MTHRTPRLRACMKRLLNSDWSTSYWKNRDQRNNLPKVLDSLSIAGLLLPSVAEETGLPTDLPVVIGANDTTCATAGAGIREPGMLLNTSGTVEVLVLCTDKPIVGPNHLIRTHAYKKLAGYAKLALASIDRMV